MSKRIQALIRPLMAGGLILFAAVSSYAAEKSELPKETPPPYERGEALSTIINPHEQINDEGEVLWGTCLICHKNVPDVQKEKSIKDVKLRFDEDPNQLCRQCHTVRAHPGSEGVSATMSGYVAPDHLVVPSKNIMMSLRLAKKEIPLILPLDPKSGKIICSTCHNPHERGLLVGRADWGGDYSMRLRSAGLDICQYCHRK